MNKHKAFTIVELLTSLVIIALLVTLLLPSITMVRRMAKETAQKAQFTTMDMALDAFKQDYGDYPPSYMNEMINPPNLPYCGAQKLTEALLGWDLQGFDPNTVWRRDGYFGSGAGGSAGTEFSYDPLRVRGTDTLFERKGPYLEVARTSVYRLGNSAGKNDGLYDLTGNVIFDASLRNYVICDVFGVKKITITRPDNTIESTVAGSPVLYYKANTNSKTFFCPVNPAQAATSIYNYYDNYDLLSLGILPNPDPAKPHKLIQPGTTGRYFCDPSYKIVDEKVPVSANGYWPHRPDSYLLISAGADHEFGTKDDILNF